MVIIAIAAASTIAVLIASVMFFVPGPQTLNAMSAEPNNSTITQTANPTEGYQKVNVTINGFTALADVAATQEQKTKGLDVRSSMAENQAMLFPFPDENNYGFWMKGMKFPIDIIWINADKKVVHIEHSLPPCTGSDLTCPIHSPSEKAKYVLETTAGFSDRHQVIEGTPVLFDLTN